MNAIEIQNLQKSYKGFTMGPLDLTLPSGCILGLIGENGAGKSTAIKLMLDMVTPDQGSVRLLGQDNQRDIRALKEDIGVVLDEVGLPGYLTPPPERWARSCTQSSATGTGRPTRAICIGSTSRRASDSEPFPRA